MEPNWIILILGLLAIIALIIFFIIRNQKDKKDLMRELIKDEEASIPKENDTEVNPSD